jgi:hypothetical protein
MTPAPPVVGTEGDDHVYAVEEQDGTLRDFGVRFDVYYEESRLYREDRIEETLAELRARGQLNEPEGALWIRTTDHGDDKDRVLVKSDGSYTYFLPDLAYHRLKAARGFEHAINVWGADHHGYVPRMQAALAALGLRDFLQVEIVQMVRIMRGGGTGGHNGIRSIDPQIGSNYRRVRLGVGEQREGETVLLLELHVRGLVVGAHPLHHPLRSRRGDLASEHATG